MCKRNKVSDRNLQPTIRNILEQQIPRHT